MRVISGGDTMTNANDIFDAAIHLMDEQNETNGETRTQDTAEYRYRTLNILNTLRHEVYPYSDTYVVNEDGTRAICPKIESFEQALDIDDAIAGGVLPYGLAAHLLMGENDTMASFFNQRYSEMLYKLGSQRTAVWEDIVV